MKTFNKQNYLSKTNITVDKIIKYYESQRSFMPKILKNGLMDRASCLNDLIDEYDAFVFDSFGVLNIGSSVIPSAASVLNKIKSSGKLVYVLTNGATYPTSKKFSLFKSWNLPLEEQHVISSRDLLKDFLSNYLDKFWGVIGSPNSDLEELGVKGNILGKNMDGLEDSEGFIFLGSEFWDIEKQNILESFLIKNPLPILVGNPDIAAPNNHGFSLEPGYWSGLLRNIPEISIQYFGKPHNDIFEFSIRKILNNSKSEIPLERIAMVGDSLHTDILGGLSSKISTILVTNYGLFANEDYESFIEETNIQPDKIIPVL